MTEDPGDGFGERVVTHAGTCPLHPDFEPTAVRCGDVVTGVKLGGKRRQTVVVREVISDVAVVGLVAYASTFEPGGIYEGSFRGMTALDPSTVELVRAVGR